MAEVHKDFHGALSYAVTFLTERHGAEEMEAFFDQVAANVFRPLIEAMKESGLKALEDHWRNIFDLEQADYDMEYEGETLVLHVNQCPAISHMKERGYDIAPGFCEHTRITNEGICTRAGFACSVEYDQDAGRCVQRFWRAEA